VTLQKLGDNITCSRNIILDMADDPRFHSNPYVDELVMFQQVITIAVSLD
jgi:hypothetical protein